MSVCQCMVAPLLMPLVQHQILPTDSTAATQDERAIYIYMYMYIYCTLPHFVIYSAQVCLANVTKQTPAFHSLTA